MEIGQHIELKNRKNARFEVYLAQIKKMDLKLSRKGIKEEIMDEIPAGCPVCKSNDYDLDVEALEDQINSWICNSCGWRGKTAELSPQSEILFRDWARSPLLNSILFIFMLTIFFLYLLIHSFKLRLSTGLLLKSLKIKIIPYQMPFILCFILGIPPVFAAIYSYILKKRRGDSSVVNKANKRTLRIWWFFAIAIICFPFIHIISSIIHESGHGMFYSILGGEWSKIEVSFVNSITRGLLSEAEGELIYISKQSWMYIGGGLVTFIAGIIFLLFLLIPSVKKSLGFSLYHYSLGGWCISHGIIFWLINSFRFLNGVGIANDTEYFLILQSTIANGITPLQVILVLTPFLIIILSLLVIIGLKIGKKFNNGRKSGILFVLSIWVGIFLFIIGNFVIQ